MMLPFGALRQTLGCRRGGQTRVGASHIDSPAQTHTNRTQMDDNLPCNTAVHACKLLVRWNLRLVTRLGIEPRTY